MPTHQANEQRRKFLVAATAGVGGVGIAATTVPFVQTMAPSEAAKAAGAPVEVDISTVAPGNLLAVAWRGKPVWIVHRTPQMLSLLDNHNNLLVDPHSKQPQQPPYAANASRSIKPAYLIVTAICTHLGCVPLYRPGAALADLEPNWPGGFYCPCHGSKFDLAGRVFKNVPAPLNLEIPPHQYVDETRLLIGKDA